MCHREERSDPVNYKSSFISIHSALQISLIPGLLRKLAMTETIKPYTLENPHPLLQEEESQRNQDPLHHIHESISPYFRVTHHFLPVADSF